jgi:hypothetical protein
MRKVLPYLGASMAALAMAWSAPVKAQDTFKDVPATHWAYQAVSQLQQQHILLGYPDGYFKGKRTLTRYEFAVALQRALASIPAPGTGPQGPPGDKGEKGDQGPPGMTPEEVQRLRQLTDEFRNELTALGANVRDINNRLDALAKDVADLRSIISKMPKWSGTLFTGVRVERSRFPFVDYSGAFRPASNTIFNRPDVLHDVHLKVDANLPGQTTARVDLVASNYLPYRGGTLSAGSAAIPSLTGGGAPTLAEQIFPYQAELDIPIGGFGTNTVLTLGRYKQQITPLTYWRPDLDAYFDTPDYDDGNFVQDGFRLLSKFGSATTSLFAGSFATPTLSTAVAGALAFNQPLIGGGRVGPPPPGGPANFLVGKPFGINPIGSQIAANTAAGIHVGIPVFNFAEVGLTAVLLSTSSNVVTPALLGTPNPFTAVTVYGANIKVNPIGRLLLNAEYAKSVTSIGVTAGDGQANDDNNAYIFNVGYNTGGLAGQAGFQYIDPRFGAPGYWNKLGNWYNPTNIQGPFVRLGYQVSDALRVGIGGDFLWGARTRPGYFGPDDNINRANARVSYTFSHKYTLSAEYEGVFYDLSPATTGLAGGAAPIEQYITVGAGLNLASNTVLKLAYQMISWNNLSGGFGPGAGYGAGVGGGGTASNASVFTTQLAVRF